MADDQGNSNSHRGNTDEAVTETFAESTSTRLPKQIGQFHIKGVLALGGMGVVYRAIQDQPRRTVAVKVMKAGIASRSAMRRFEYESQVLARLRHPGIAQVFEAGTHDDGTCVVPFFAMEYIPNAKPITQFAEPKGLGTRERLRLFLHVCDAVHHGHQKGIVHRDLKPDNILVDPDGEVKIIDFGVARGTDSDLAVTTLQTDVGQLVGTLQYMSPEQCEADPGAIDARSDVYALGVVLYELVTGQLPYSVSKKHIFDGTQVIRETPPTKPSTINRTLRGDVETIVLKALEKDPSRRYQSATALAHDIRAYLAGEAINARPPSAVYRVGLYARRHKGPIGAAALVAFVTLLATILVVNSNTKARRAEDAIAAALGRATAAERDAAASRVTGVPTDREAEDLVGSVPGEFSLSTLNGKAVDSTDFAGHKATVFNFVALDCPFCLMQIPKVEDIRAEYESKGVRFVSLIATLTTDYPLPAAAKAIEKLGSKTELAKDVDNNLVKMFRVTGYPLLFVLDEQARVTHVNRGNRGDVSAVLRGQLDSVLYGIPTPEEQLVEAEKLHRQTLQNNRRTLGDGHRDSIRAMENLAVNLTAQGKHDEAESVYHQIWTLRSRMLGETDPLTLASMHKLGEVMQSRGKSAEAESMHRQTLEVRRSALGENHPDTRLSIAHLGLALHSQGKTEGARPYIAELIELRRQATLVQDAEPEAFGAYARLLLNCEPEDLRDPKTALRAAQEAARLSGRQKPRYLTTLARAERMTGNLQGAIQTQTEALALIPVGNMGRRWREEQLLVNYLKEANDYAGVERMYLNKIARQRATAPAGSPMIGMSLGELGRFLLERKRYSEAEATFRECRAIAREALPDGNTIVASIEVWLGMALAGQGKLEDADHLLTGALSQIANADGVRPKQLGDMLIPVIQLYTDLGQPERAEKYRALLPPGVPAEKPVP